MNTLRLLGEITVEQLELHIPWAEFTLRSHIPFYEPSGCEITTILEVAAGNRSCHSGYLTIGFFEDAFIITMSTILTVHQASARSITQRLEAVRYIPYAEPDAIDRLITAVNTYLNVIKQLPQTVAQIPNDNVPAPLRATR